MKNARQNVECSIDDLQKVKQHLDQALQSVEKQENKARIQQTCDAVQSALTKAQDTINNYVES
ncbi:hypothetical protein [Clostridium sp. UBA1652]|uniref:hypothetical protein n=1 Tax=Clostridium sp. UBA1652 TaxID=1946348 RepID=UPI00257A79F3|nr:hypothetical protein [Clostridium sp. UBA1652]